MSAQTSLILADGSTCTMLEAATYGYPINASFSGMTVEHNGIRAIVARSDYGDYYRIEFASDADKSAFCSKSFFKAISVRVRRGVVEVDAGRHYAKVGMETYGRPDWKIVELHNVVDMRKARKALLQAALKGQALTGDDVRWSD